MIQTRVHRKRTLAAFTLIELIIVVVIVVILSGIALPNYYKAKERALGREGIIALRLIAAAEKIYKIEYNSYYPSSGKEPDINIINSNLRLNLPNTNWDYYITGGSGTFTANADRKGSGGYLDCAYYITESMNEPGASASCP